VIFKGFYIKMDSCFMAEWAILKIGLELNNPPPSVIIITFLSRRYAFQP